MTLTEFLKANPDAKAEYDKALVSAKAEGEAGERERILGIAEDAGADIPESAVKAIKDGTAEAEFTKEEIKRVQAAARNGAGKGKQFSAIRARQTPGEQSPDEARETAGQIMSIDEDKLKAKINKFVGGQQWNQ